MFASLVLVLTAPGPASPQALLTAYRTASPPVLDADFPEPCWQAASVASPFAAAQGAGLVEEQTQVRMCWDEVNLYVAVEALESLLTPALNLAHLVKAERSGRDVPAWLDDSVEVFVQPPGGKYYHFVANSGTGTYEAEGFSAAWNCDWRCAAIRSDRSYRLEMAIPFAPMGAPTGAWRANVTRFRPSAREYSNWSGLQGSHHQPEAFGILQFAPAGPAVGPVKLAPEGEAVQVTASLSGSDAATRLQVAAASGQDVRSSEVSGDGPHTVTVPLPEAALTSGRCEVTYSLRQGDQVLLRSAALPQALAAAVVTLQLDERAAETGAFVNGAPVLLDAAGGKLHLRAGLNVLALEARATGARPALRPRLTFGERELELCWVTRTDETPGWKTDLPREGWESVARRNGWLWAQDQAPAARFVTALYVGPRGPQLFPKLDTFCIPLGSRQLLRVYLHSPHDVPPEGYRMIVEAPAALRYVAADPLGGGAISGVTEAGRFTLGGVKMVRHAVSYDTLPGQGFELAMRWGDKAGSTMTYQPTLTGGGTVDWRRLSMTVTAPPGAVSAHPLIIKWQNRGTTGTFWVDNVVFRAKEDDRNLLQMGTFDEPEWGDPWFLRPEGQDGSKCVKVVSTPGIADQQQAVWVDKEAVVPVEAGREYAIELDLKCERLGSPRARPVCGLLLEAPRDLPEGDLPLYTYFESMDGLVRELPAESRVRILPPLRNVRPRQARITPCYYGSRFTSPEVAKAFADNCHASGITWTYGGVGNDVVWNLRERGHSVFLSLGWEPWAPPPGQADALADHPELQARDFAGTPLPHTYCPTWLLAEGQAVLEALEQWVLGVAADPLYRGVNWDLEQPVVDPPTFCTCDRCLAAFRAFAGLPADTALTPDRLLSDHRARWTDFRCTQNAEMAGRLNAMLGKLGRPIEFSVYSGYQSTYTREHYGVDWKLLAPHLDFAIAGYNGPRADIRATLDALGGVPFMGGEMWYLDDRSDDRPPPRWETWRNRLLRQYAESGGRGCLIWWLPTMDGAAFYATSEAAEIIAQYEEFFSAGERCDQEVQVAGLPDTDWLALKRNGSTVVLLMNSGAQPTDVRVSAGSDRMSVPLEAYGARVLSLNRIP